MDIILFTTGHWVEARGRGTLGRGTLQRAPTRGYEKLLKQSFEWTASKMDIILFTTQHPPKRLETLEKCNGNQMLWLDFDHQTQDWFRHFKDSLNFEIDEQYLLTNLRDLHPTLFDQGQPSYDRLVFRGLGPSANPEHLETQPIAFFLFKECLVTIHLENHSAINTLKQRFLNNHPHPSPARPEALMHQILEEIVEQFLVLKESFSEKLEQLHSKLLYHNFREWHLFIIYKRQLRRLENLCEQQVDALMRWREDAQGGLDGHLVMRYNDLVDHIYRVINHIKYLQGEIEFLIQLQFSAQAQRLNEIFIFLTLLSVIFLPLNLMVGIFGMNFEALPLIKNPAGPLYIFSSMGLLVTSFLLFFKWKKWW